MFPDFTPVLAMVGIDSACAPFEVRESFCVPPAGAQFVLDEARRIPGLREAALLQTCHRTELYLVGDRPAIADDAAALLHRTRRGGAADMAPLTALHGDAVAAHLFRVACGLESAVIGDAHIAGQIRQAFAGAADARSLGSTLSELQRQSCALARRARCDTDIARGSASEASAVADMVTRQREAVGRPLTVLFVGAGAMIRECARYTATRAVGHLCIVNRTEAHARRLARDCGASVVPWADRHRHAAAADVVVSAVSAMSPVLTAAGCDAADGGGRRPSLIIDLSMPRSVAADFPAPLVDIDGIAAACRAAFSRRAASVDAVERLVAAQLESWRLWCEARTHEHMLKTLFESEVRGREALAAAMAAAFGAQTDQVNRLLRGFTRPLLREHARALRQLNSPERAPRARVA